MTSTKSKNKVCAIIPFYNEEKHLRNVINSTLEFVDEVIAVNDGSTDNSVLTLKDFTNITLLNIENNTGKGYALQQGFNQVMRKEYDVVVTLDGDGQHKPESIPLMLKKLEFFDLVIGNRLNDVKSMPVQRRLSNRLTSLLLSKKLGINILDSQSGFRAYKKKVIEQVKTYMSGFEAESEMLVNAARKKFSIGFVDIPTIYADEKSKMKSYQAIKGFIRILMS